MPVLYLNIVFSNLPGSKKVPPKAEMETSAHSDKFRVHSGREKVQFLRADMCYGLGLRVFMWSWGCLKTDDLGYSSF